MLLVNNLECIEIPYEEFEFFSQIVLESIKSGKGTFEIPEIELFLQKIKITKIKASNDSKKDIIFKIHDDFTDAEPIIGFSIKSYIENKLATGSSLASIGLILTVFMIATKMIKKAIGFVLIGVILVVAVTYFKISGVF